MPLLLALLIVGPAAGCLAGLVWLFVLGLFLGFGSGFLRLSLSDFVAPGNYIPFAKAMFYAVPFAYYPAYRVCRNLAGRRSRLAYVAAGIVASLFPAVLLALNDDGSLLRAIFRLHRFINEVFEFETLVLFGAFSVASVPLTAAYWRLTRNSGRPHESPNGAR